MVTGDMEEVVVTEATEATEVEEVTEDTVAMEAVMAAALPLKKSSKKPLPLRKSPKKPSWLSDLLSLTQNLIDG